MYYLDVKGLYCPLPILRTSRYLQGLEIGDVLCIEATDPKTVRDFTVFCRVTDYELLSYREVGDIFYFEIKKLG